jgi:hypothetical protein
MSHAFKEVIPATRNTKELRQLHGGDGQGGTGTA